MDTGNWHTIVALQIYVHVLLILHWLLIQGNSLTIEDFCLKSVRFYGRLDIYKLIVKLRTQKEHSIIYCRSINATLIKVFKFSFPFLVSYLDYLSFPFKI